MSAAGASGGEDWEGRNSTSGCGVNALGGGRLRAKRQQRVLRRDHVHAPDHQSMEAVVNGVLLLQMGKKRAAHWCGGQKPKLATGAPGWVGGWGGTRTRTSATAEQAMGAARITENHGCRKNHRKHQLICQPQNHALRVGPPSGSRVRVCVLLPAAEPTPPWTNPLGATAHVRTAPGSRPSPVTPPQRTVHDRATLSHPGR